MTQYCCGFLIDPNAHEVVLIKKTHPDWQKGKLNGVGGVILNTESATLAMSREFSEETGYRISPSKWRLFSVLGDSRGWQVHFFFAFFDEAPRFMKNVVRTKTDEEIAVYNIKDLNALNVLPNLRWLIPMAMTMEFEKTWFYDIRERV